MHNNCVKLLLTGESQSLPLPPPASELLFQHPHTEILDVPLSCPPMYPKCPLGVLICPPMYPTCPLTYLPQGIVHIQLCSDFNALPDEECMEQLRMSNNVLAVESPAYFRAYQPVLDALKELDLSRVHFL